MVDERESLLCDLGVPPGVLALAMQRAPADLFEGMCGRVANYYDIPPRRRAMDLLPPEVVPLWAGPFGFHDEVVGCRRSAGGLEYVGQELHTKGVGDPEDRAPSQARFYARWALGDTDPVAPYLIARSDQGLLFWLFSDILSDFNWEKSEEDKRYLQTASEVVGFRHLDAVWSFFWGNLADPEYPKSGTAFYERYEIDLLSRTRGLAEPRAAAAADRPRLF
jgi:hypothetical protein